MNHRNLSLLVVAALAATAMAGCMNANASSGGAAIFVKDDPADDVAHLWVTFNKVQLHQMENKTAEREENERQDAEADDDARQRSEHSNATAGPGNGRVSIAIEVDEENDSDSEAKWITILDQNVTVDLKAFNGTARAFLGDAEVPVGSYNQIRLTVVAAKLQLKDGTTANVTVPGHAIRIKGHFMVEQSKETQLTIDFDLDKSLHQTGNGKWMLKPVLHLEGEKRDKPHDDERRERMRERDDEDERSREHGDH